MATETNTIPRIAIRSIGGGLLLMAFFTMMWAGIAEGGLRGADHGIVLIIFSSLSLLFIIYAVYLFVISKRFSKLTNEEDIKEGKRMGKWYAIIFGTEGAVIGITCGILACLHYTDLIIPSIALIVGIHFYPMAKLFNRKIDYYLATWTCIVALTGIIALIKKFTALPDVMVFTGTGVAFATSCYGIYMLYAGRQFTKIK